MAGWLVLGVGLVVLLVAVALGGTLGLLSGLAIVAAFGLVVMIVVTALRSIFQGALYLYARHGRHVSAFSRQEIMGAFTGRGGTVAATTPMDDRRKDWKGCSIRSHAIRITNHEKTPTAARATGVLGC